MKLFGILAAVGIAKDEKWSKVEKRGGKHGRVSVDGPGQDRLLLHYPICMTNREHPLCDSGCVKKYTQLSGQIRVKNYDSFKSCLWEIEVPATHTLSFQFKDTFDLEFHQRCGYDRVHIFSGTIEGDNQRQGRFCGPKPGTGKPFDGSGRNVEINNNMPFYDSAFDIQSNTAFIGFDADQSFVGGGFTLTWNAFRTTNIDFTNVFEAHQYITKQARYLFNAVMFESAKDKKKFEKQLEGKIIRASQSALQNNPGSVGDKKRRCAKSEQIPVSNDIVSKCTQLQSKVDSMTADFSDAMDVIIDLITEYLGDCKKAGERWPDRVSGYARNVANDRKI